MNIFNELAKKPWLNDPAEVEGVAASNTVFMPSAKIGLRVFLIVVSVIFALTTIAYGDRMLFANWKPMPGSWILWLNTGFLITSSIAMQWATLNVKRDNINGVRDGLVLGGVFTTAFLVGQLYVWQQMIQLGYYANISTANAFFYLVTALHGIHMIGGLVAWGRSILKLRKVSSSNGSINDVRLSVELCTTYWHYLLLIWLILFTLLLIS
jgi:cytochrome c oxidase subunit 3